MYKRMKKKQLGPGYQETNNYVVGVTPTMGGVQCPLSHRRDQQTGRDHENMQRRVNSCSIVGLFYNDTIECV
jgi:hypothetical protein